MMYNTEPKNTIERTIAKSCATNSIDGITPKAGYGEERFHNQAAHETGWVTLQPQRQSV